MNRVKNLFFLNYLIENEEEKTRRKLEEIFGVLSKEVIKNERT